MTQTPPFELSGTVEKVIYRNEKNGYTVLEIQSEDKTITAVGSIPGVSIGEELKLTGNWKNHATFGRQFDVKSFECLMPSTETAILKYLSSGAIKGIGPVFAEKLVQKFGDRTLEVIENEPEKLSLIKGITKSKAQKIAEEFKAVFGLREVIAHLSKYKITPKEAILAFGQWGNQTLDIINENPYRLCEDPIFLDFGLADSISFSMKRPFNDLFRIRAGIFHLILHNVKSGGHTCLPIDKLTDACAKFIGTTAKEVASTLESLKLEGSLIFQIFQEKEFAFLPELYHCESYAAQRLAMMLKFPAQSIIGIKSLIENIENSEGIKYAARQKEAIESALNKGLLVLTGGPGTGKTTTLNAIIKILKQKGEKIYLAAPTGRAAQRMTEVTGEEAKTIHRLLEVEWNPENKQVFRRNEKNLLKCDTLILDEFSMVDSFMFDAILRSLPLSCRLIMVGDENQLPSVGAGNILGDIIHSAKVPTIHLNEIFRQSLKSLIITNAHRIVNGIMPELAIRNNDFFFLEMQDSKHIINTVLDLCCNRLPKTYAYSPLFDIQVLCPGRKGPLGTNELNKELQQVLNPSSKAATQEHRFSWANPNKEYKKEINIGEITLREGDKVMQTRNNYDIPFVRSDGSNSQGVFNGDIGILTKIDKQNNSFSVKFDDKQALYDIDNAIDLELAYSITIHKSQGSEFEAVIIPIFHGPPQLYFRNLLYTAVTRAKSMLILVGIRDIVAKMVENDKKTKRYSGLYHTLMET